IPILNLWQPNTLTIDGSNTWSGNISNTSYTGSGTPITILGNNPVTFTGSNAVSRGFFVHQGNVTLKNMSLQNLIHLGGGTVGGGGAGMGAGAALFVNKTSGANTSVTISGLTFKNNVAQ